MNCRVPYEVWPGVSFTLHAASHASGDLGDRKLNKPR